MKGWLQTVGELMVLMGLIAMVAWCNGAGRGSGSGTFDEYADCVRTLSARYC
jgi:hypothetical protein